MALSKNTLSTTFLLYWLKDSLSKKRISSLKILKNETDINSIYFIYLSNFIIFLTTELKAKAHANPKTLL